MITKAEFKQELIGRREGMLYALDLLETQRQALINSIKSIDKKLKEE